MLFDVLRESANIPLTVVSLMITNCYRKVLVSTLHEHDLYADNIKLKRDGSWIWYVHPLTYFGRNVAINLCFRATDLIISRAYIRLSAARVHSTYFKATSNCPFPASSCSFYFILFGDKSRCKHRKKPITKPWHIIKR
jgi:hypothetical protein